MYRIHCFGMPIGIKYRMKTHFDKKKKESHTKHIYLKSLNNHTIYQITQITQITQFGVSIHFDAMICLKINSLK